MGTASIRQPSRPASRLQVGYGLRVLVHVGTRPERSGVSGWFCWAVPLLITEFAIQGRKILRAKALDAIEA